MVQQFAHMFAGQSQIGNTLSFSGWGEFSVIFFLRHETVLFC
jgi:hypothetical protein